MNTARYTHSSNTLAGAPANRPSHTFVLLTVKEVAQSLKIAESLVYKLVAAKELPAVHIGRSIRIMPSDLDAFITQHRISFSDLDLL